MGREVKRVPLDFNWPIGKTYHGYLMPKNLCPGKCIDCGQSGYNPATHQIEEDFYDSQRTGKRWVNNITQDEVQALVDEDRLYDFTHRWSPEQRKWIRREDNYIPTAHEINEWSRHGLAHDAINRCILIETRATRLGVYGKCEKCNGRGYIYKNKEQEVAHDAWERTHPETGSGWQMWENTSDGSPISPVFATPELLATWLAEKGASACGIDTATYEQWLAMIKIGYAWDMASTPTTNGLISGVAAAPLLKQLETA